MFCTLIVHTNAPTKKKQLDIISELSSKNKRNGKWIVDSSKPKFTQVNERIDKDTNKFKHFGRSRLVVEVETPGGAVASLMFLRVSVY